LRYYLEKRIAKYLTSELLPEFIKNSIDTKAARVVARAAKGTAEGFIAAGRELVYDALHPVETVQKLAQAAKVIARETDKILRYIGYAQLQCDALELGDYEGAKYFKQCSDEAKQELKEDYKQICKLAYDFSQLPLEEQAEYIGYFLGHITGDFVIPGKIGAGARFIKELPTVRRIAHSIKKAARPIVLASNIAISEPLYSVGGKWITRQTKNFVEYVCFITENRVSEIGALEAIRVASNPIIFGELAFIEKQIVKILSEHLPRLNSDEIVVLLGGSRICKKIAHIEEMIVAAGESIPIAEKLNKGKGAIEAVELVSQSKAVEALSSTSKAAEDFPSFIKILQSGNQAIIEKEISTFERC